MKTNPGWIVDRSNKVLELFANFVSWICGLKLCDCGSTGPHLARNARENCDNNSHCKAL